MLGAVSGDSIPYEFIYSTSQARTSALSIRRQEAQPSVHAGLLEFSWTIKLNSLP